MIKNNKFKLELHWQVAIALILAAALGGILSPDDEFAGINIIAILSLIGTLFLNALKMVVVPLVVTSIMAGVFHIANDHAFGRLGLKTFIYYIMTGVLAVTTGLVLVNLVMPGEVTAELSQKLMRMVGQQDGSFMERVAGRTLFDIAEIFIRLIPENLFQAALESQLLGLIFFSMVFGFFGAKLKEKNESLGSALINLIEGIQEVMILITLWIIRFMPYGIFALVTKIFASSGVDVIVPMLKFFLTVVAALAIHFFITLPLLLRFVGGVSTKKYMGQVSPALLTAFSTASSSATLPISLNSIQKNAKVSKRISSFVLPLGATVNMDGTALYECVVVLFIAQLYGVDLSIATQVLVVLLALLTSIGVAGIPAASLVAITLILTAVGLPIEAMGLILVVDRILDMLRTSTNVFSDLTCTCIIARSEGEDLPASLNKSNLKATE